MVVNNNSLCCSALTHDMLQAVRLYTGVQEEKEHCAQGQEQVDGEVEVPHQEQAPGQDQDPVQ
jgi:hypothetical protein